MKYAVHIFPSIVDKKTIDDIRSKYDPLSDKIPPHVTLVFPFDYDLAPETLISHVQLAISGYQSFELTFGAPESHDPYVWLPVAKGKEKIKAMHDVLYTGILRHHLSSNHRYIPHLTIARLSKDTFDTYACIQNLNSETKGTADQVIIERILADGASETVAGIPLK